MSTDFNALLICLAVRQANEHYSRGWKNGHTDKMLGLSPLIVALSSPNLDYADGYRAGYHASKDELDKVFGPRV